MAFCSLNRTFAAKIIRSFSINQTDNKMNKQTIITILLAFVVSSLMAQPSDPKGLYKLSEIIHQDGKHLEAQFKQYKFCLDKYSLTVGRTCEFRTFQS